MQNAHAVALRQLLLLAVIGLPAAMAQATPPGEFEIVYDARLGSWAAESSRSLHHDQASGEYRMQALSRIRLLGQDLVRIDEQANFAWHGDSPRAISYHFDQSGIGARERRVDFDWQHGLAHYAVEDETGTLPVTGEVYDELTAFLAIRQQLQAGNKEIAFTVLDRSRLETWRFRVIDEEVLHTDLGDFASVHVERIRENSERRTEFWMASDYDYLVLKLVQEEPNGRTLTLNVESASFNGEPLQGLKEQHMEELAALSPLRRR